MYRATRYIPATIQQEVATLDIQSLTVGAPKGPFPILQFDIKTRRAITVARAGTIETARAAMASGAASFLQGQRPKPGKQPRKVRYLDPNHAALFFSDGTLATVLAVEVVPIPDGATHPGDILVDKPGVK